MLAPDTIAAISTAPGEAGLAVIRLSGPEAIAIADRVVHARTKPSAMPARTFLYGHIRNPSQSGPAPVDEVIVLLFRAPHSYTCEDVVEIQGHGGRVAAHRILRTLLACGARLAEPGEFTRRAFLNGRLDLVQAEAVADLIGAQSERAAAAAIDQLNGSISSCITAIYDDSISLSADIEATMDFAEDELPETTLDGLVARLQHVRIRVASLVATWHEGHLLREGARVVIAGEPNVGKSTLMNRLLARDRSIVTDIPGTTRDTIEEQLVLSGIPIRLIDTAGLREADCRVEQEGIRRAEEAIRTADVSIYLVDGSQGLTSEDTRRLAVADQDRCLVIINKCDLGERVPPEALRPVLRVLRTSLLRDGDVSAVKSALVDVLGVNEGVPPHAVVAERHYRALTAVQSELIQAEDALQRNEVDGALLAAEHLRTALERLGEITGREFSTELLDAIFSRFCIGK